MKRSVAALGIAALIGVVGVLSCGSDPDCTTGTVRIEAIALPEKVPAGGGIVTVQVELNGTIVASATGPLDASTGTAIIEVPLPTYRSGDEVLLRAHLSDSSGRVVGTWFNLVTLPSGCLSTEANLFVTPITNGGITDGSIADARAPMPDASQPVADAAPMVTIDGAVQPDVADTASDAMSVSDDASTEDGRTEDAGVDAP